MFRLFDQMSIKPNSVIFTILLNACAALPNDEGKKRGRQALQHLPQAFLTDINLMNAAIDMLMRFGDVEHAEQIFHSMKEKNDVTYGSIMKGNSAGFDSTGPTDSLHRLCDQSYG